MAFSSGASTAAALEWDSEAVAALGRRDARTVVLVRGDAGIGAAASARGDPAPLPPLARACRTLFLARISHSF